MFFKYTGFFLKGLVKKCYLENSYKTDKSSLCKKMKMEKCHVEAESGYLCIYYTVMLFFTFEYV